MLSHGNTPILLSELKPMGGRVVFVTTSDKMTGSIRFRVVGRVGGGESNRVQPLRKRGRGKLRLHLSIILGCNNYTPILTTTDLQCKAILLKAILPRAILPRAILPKAILPKAILLKAIHLKAIHLKA
jgi:hypothetical protein